MVAVALPDSLAKAVAGKEKSAASIRWKEAIHDGAASFIRLSKEADEGRVFDTRSPLWAKDISHKLREDFNFDANAAGPK